VGAEEKSMSRLAAGFTNPLQKLLGSRDEATPKSNFGVIICIALCRTPRQNQTLFPDVI
jgi:hypothetical protein